MTFLELCQAVHRKTGYTGSIATVVAQAGDRGLVVEWVKEAWNDLQALHGHWSFLRVPMSEAVAQDQAVVSPANFRDHVPHTFRLGGRPLNFIRYEDYRTDPNSVWGGPAYTVTPGRSIQLLPAATAAASLTGDYWRTPQALVADADTPLLHADLRLAIVYQALEYFVQHEGAQDVYTGLRANPVSKWILRMENECLPAVRMAGPLA